MRFYNKYSNFNKEEDRRRLISYLVRILNSDGRFEPYNSMPEDEYYWTLDMGNDWHLNFFPDQPTEFDLRYRYNRYGVGLNDPSKDREYIIGLILGFSSFIHPVPCHICKSTRYHPTDKKEFCSACGILP